MRGGRGLTKLNNEAVLYEYEQALKIGALGRAQAIYLANPDLQGEMDIIRGREAILYEYNQKGEGGDERDV